MQSLKKRIATLLLAAAMAVTMLVALPAHAFADEPEPEGSPITTQAAMSVDTVDPSGTGVPLQGFLWITFTGPLYPAITGDVTLTGGNGNLSFSRWITLNEIEYNYSGLDPNTTYTVNISGFLDINSDPMDPDPDNTHTFTTAGLVSVAGQPINVVSGTWEETDPFVADTITVPYSQATIAEGDIVMSPNDGSLPWDLFYASDPGTPVVGGYAPPGSVATLDVGSNEFLFRFYDSGVEDYVWYALTIIREPDVPPLPPAPQPDIPPSLPQTGDCATIPVLAAILLATAGLGALLLSRRLRRTAR